MVRGKLRAAHFLWSIDYWQKELLRLKSRGTILPFLQKGELEVSFSMEAHAFLEMIGNKSLIDLQECDKCNKFFADTIEDAFGKWTMPWRSPHMVPGKNGVPTSKSKDKKLRIESNRPKHLVISIESGDERCTVDPDTGKVTITLTRDPFLPMAAYKCLVKMALSVMPEDLREECSHLYKWVLEERQSFESFPYKPLSVLVTKISGPLPRDRIDYYLYKRLEENNSAPYLQFVVLFGNNQYQIFLPMPNQDKELISKGTVSILPHPHRFGLRKHIDQYGGDSITSYDLSSPDRCEGSAEKLTFLAESIKPIPPEEIPPEDMPKNK
ncbi:hypothetical protein ACE0DR_00995 [Azotobacter sp. CWF10]